MKYFPEGGWFLPSGEDHLPEWMLTVDRRIDGRLGYQYHKYELALPWVRQRRLAVDVGAHVGLWSWYLSRDFMSVRAFEPMPDHRECWLQNMAGCDNADLEPFALGDAEQTVHLATRTRGSSGDTGVVDRDDHPEAIVAEMRTLDSFDLFDLDFLKVDCEGYELFVLKGAVETLKRCKPCVIVEQKPGMADRYDLGTTEAVSFLQSLGAVLRADSAGDYILSWD